MEKRKFTIEIDEMGWHISSVGKGNTTDDKLEVYFSFVEVLDGKIVHLGDYWLSDEMLDLKSKLLLEVCIFTHDKHSFEGSLADALEYINKNKAFK